MAASCDGGGGDGDTVGPGGGMGGMGGMGGAGAVAATAGAAGTGTGAGSGPLRKNTASSRYTGVKPWNNGVEASLAFTTSQPPSTRQSRSRATTRAACSSPKYMRTLRQKMTSMASVPVATDGYAPPARFRLAKRTWSRRAASISKRPSPSGRKNAARSAGSVRRNDQRR
jgi:hypothetical protein